MLISSLVALASSLSFTGSSNYATSITYLNSPNSYTSATSLILRYEITTDDSIINDDLIIWVGDYDIMSFEFAESAGALYCYFNNANLINDNLLVRVSANNGNITYYANNTDLSANMLIAPSSVGGGGLFFNMGNNSRVGKINIDFAISNYTWNDYVNEYLESNKSDIYNNGFQAGHDEGYQEGFNAGVEYYQDIGNEPAIIFSGILDVALVPVNIFLAFLNFEVFGINISALVSSLLTITIVIIIVKMLIGNGGGKSD